MPKLTYANVVSTLCLAVLVLGGPVAVAATQLPKNSVGAKQLKHDAVTGAKIKDGSVGGTDIDEATLSRVPSAVAAASASTAADASRLAGVPASAYVRSDASGAFVDAPDVRHDAARSDCAGVADDVWVDRSNDVNERTGYWRDPLGVVHLRGSVMRCNFANAILTLPLGLRPSHLQHFAVSMEGSSPDVGSVILGGDGKLYSTAGTLAVTVALDGITFRCAPSGVNGCP